MTTNSSLLRQVVLRHRADGYLRFDLPSSLCFGEAAAVIQRRLDALTGVYRVSFHPAYGKLAVRFHPAVCDQRRVALALSQAVSALETSGVLPACEHCATRELESAPASGLKARVLGLAPVRWARDKAREVRQTSAALRQLSMARFKKVPAVLEDPGKAMHEFVTDVLVLYLIKVHWDRITGEWLRAPIRFRYEWLAVFYLTYLMVRARRRGH